MSSTYNNNSNSNYSIYVTAHTGGHPEREKLESPRVSISWNVISSCKSENPSFRRSIEDYNSMQSNHDVFASIASTDHDYMSPQSREIVSRMISRINFPFELEKLNWKGFGNLVKPLNNIDDMITHILEVINGMVVKGRKKVDLNVRVEMQYTLPHGEYEAKVQAEDRASLARQSTENLMSLVSMLQHQLAHVGNQHEAVNRMTWRFYHEKRREIEEEMRANNISTETIMHDPRLLEMEAAIAESFDQSVFKSRPASKASVEALKKLVLKDNRDGGSSLMCVICQEEMLSGSEVIRLPCSKFHMFHGDCIIKWLNRFGHTCPICKFKLPREKKPGGERTKSRV